MKFRLFLVGLLAISLSALAHVGSPDVFYDGTVGQWPTHITVRMPSVVPGLAEIIAQIKSNEPITVTITPLASSISASNAPPPDRAELVRGQTNLYSGNLWLMTTGAYSIDVHIHSATADASVLVPVNSVATKQLPLPSWLGDILSGAALLLFVAGMVIVGGAAGQSTLAPGAEPTVQSRFKYRVAFVVTGLVLAAALYGGKKWWDKDENDFRGRLRDGGWPDLDSSVRVEGSQRILHLDLGKNDFAPNDNLDLTLDHGKLLHLFVISLPEHRAIAHIHPFQRDGKSFDVLLPPLAEGDYELFCDCTFSSGLSSTATNTIHLPAIPPASSRTNSLEPDPDDSFALNVVPVSAGASGDTTFRFPDGSQILWKAHEALHPSQNAGLQFQRSTLLASLPRSNLTWE